jgi:hypothetical protein
MENKFCDCCGKSVAEINIVIDHELELCNACYTLFETVRKRIKKSQQKVIKCSWGFECFMCHEIITVNITYDTQISFLNDKNGRLEPILTSVDKNNFVCIDCVELLKKERGVSIDEGS